MSGQVAFFPTNGRCPCILCDQWLGKGGGELPRVDFSGYRLSIAKVKIWEGGGGGRERNQ
jgi:hypothetical protein